MADSPNVAVVRRLYQARGNPEIIRQVLGREVRWEVVDGFPYGAVYEGLDRVLRDFFAASQTVTNSSPPAPSSLSQATMSSPSAAIRDVPAKSGKKFTARFAHVWTLQDGLIVRLQQCADTVQLARALAH